MSIIKTNYANSEMYCIVKIVNIVNIVNIVYVTIEYCYSLLR